MPAHVIVRSAPARRGSSGWGWLGLLACVACGNAPRDPSGDDCRQSPGALFEKRVAPLLESERPASCSACHASGVRLEDFVRNDACEAMACLRAEGLVDLNDPENSVLLAWIGRAEPQSALVGPELVQQERAAFLEWFRHEANCGSCSDTQCPDPAPSSCDEGQADEQSLDANTDPGDCDQATLERLFRGTVYENRERCSPCHFESKPLATREAPRFFADTGTCLVSSLATYLRVQSAGYINVTVPARSLLLTKPLPEAEGGVPHGGHAKFADQQDSAYQAFLYFIERYSACEADPP